MSAPKSMLTLAVLGYCLLAGFETAKGQPMAQFLDGLRAVSDPPHVAVVPLDPSKVELFTVPPNRYQQVQQVANPVVAGGLMVEVGDGCRPVITTLIGRQIGFDEFRAALVKAKILPFAPEHASHTSCLPLGCSDLLCPHGAK